VKIQIVSFICVCVQEKQSVTAIVYLSSAITLGPWRQKGGLKRRKGGKFDHRPGRPKVLLRHWQRIRSFHCCCCSSSSSSNIFRCGMMVCYFTNDLCDHSLTIKSPKCSVCLYVNVSHVVLFTVVFLVMLPLTICCLCLPLAVESRSVLSLFHIQYLWYDFAPHLSHFW